MFDTTPGVMATVIQESMWHEVLINAPLMNTSHERLKSSTIRQQVLMGVPLRSCARPSNFNSVNYFLGLLPVFLRTGSQRQRLPS